MTDEAINKSKSAKKRRRNSRSRGQDRDIFLLRAYVSLMTLGLLVWCGLQWNFLNHLETILTAHHEYYDLSDKTAAIGLIQQALRKLELQNNGNGGNHLKAAHQKHKFLIFHRIQDAQGAGNHLHGLLAAHLLADEFNRIVCVSNHYSDFHLAFEVVDPIVAEFCPDILKRHNKEPPETKQDHTISLLNYRGGANECYLKELLASSARVLHLTGNTYPRWPRVPSHINFFKFYKAKPILLDILPYPVSQPPPIVVHLRHADNEGGDTRKGLDDASLRALGELLPLDPSQHSPFLVTNNVQWYDKFEKDHGWFHPQWDVVMHSALGYMWQERQSEARELSRSQKILQQKYEAYKQKLAGTQHWESLKLWADWYTLLTAEKVYHTFSDFSLSAVHWQNTWSRTYDGIDPSNGKMILLEENWIVDGEQPRLLDRNQAELRNCNISPRHAVADDDQI